MALIQVNPEIGKFLKAQWKDYSFHQERHFDDVPTCLVCRKTGFTQVNKNQIDLLDQEFEKNQIEHSTILAQHIENMVAHLENDLQSVEQDWLDGWLDESERDGFYATIEKLKEIGKNIDTPVSTTVNYFQDPDVSDVKLQSKFGPRIKIGGYDISKDTVNDYIESIERLQRVSKAMKLRPKEGLLVNALHYRTKMHTAIFEQCGLDHDSANPAETKVRNALDKYVESRLAGKPGWEEFDLFTRPTRTKN